MVETTDGVSNIPSVFVDTGLEYPEVRSFAMSQPNVTVIKPSMRFDHVVAKYGYPVVSKEVAAKVEEIRTTKSKYLRHKRLHGDAKGAGKLPNKWQFLIDAPFLISSKCCRVMKKTPIYKYERLTKQHGFVGTMACESSLRMQSWMKYGCNAFELNHPQSRPLSFWTEQDILEYIIRFNLPYASVYGDIVQDETGKYRTTGVDRTGCMYCMFGANADAEPNRFQRMKQTHPKQWDYCINKLGLREVLDYISVKYE